MLTYRKIGGIHWFSLGRLRVSFCVARAKPATLDLSRPAVAARFATFIRQER